MKRKISIFLCMICLIASFPFTAAADMGPKPSVTVDITGLEGETCYATLLSKQQGSGNHHVWKKGETFGYGPEDKEYNIFLKFAEYEDPDGYFFLRFLQDCTETGQIYWGYYPPEEFKILLYFPEKDLFAASDGAYIRYAFHSRYTVDVTEIKNLSDTTSVVSVTAHQSPRYGKEAVSLFIRVILTILIELGLAWCFALRERGLLAAIIKVNIITQVLLNLILSWINYKQGMFLLILYYVLLETAVFIIEAAVYAIEFPKKSGGTVSVWKAAGYALAANLVSFGAGFWLIVLFPALNG